MCVTGRYISNTYCIVVVSIVEFKVYKVSYIVVTILNKLVRNQTQQINKIGHELQGVLCKVSQDDMFRST